MKSRSRQRSFLGIRRRHLFNIYLLFGSVSIVVATTVFTIRVAKSVERQSYLTTRLFADLASRLLLADKAEEIQPLIEIINEIEVPFVITDNAGRPLLWNEPVIGIPLPDYAVPDEHRPFAPAQPGHRRDPDAGRQLRRRARALRHQGSRRPPPGHPALGPVGAEPRASASCRTSSCSIMALFFLVIIWALQNKKQAEQTALFAGMAKETAHQLGTPLTSIMGWVALLEEKVDPKSDLMVELNRDVDRLGMISARFSQIGSLPKLDDTAAAGGGRRHRRVLPPPSAPPGRTGAAAPRGPCRDPGGLQPRPAGLGTGEPDQERHRRPDRRQGHASRCGSRTAARTAWRCTSADTGRGIPPGVGNRIFEPGFTTKQRGWGMGLALVKRIVVQYHGGRIRIARPGPTAPPSP